MGKREHGLYRKPFATKPEDLSEPRLGSDDPEGARLDIAMWDLYVLPSYHTNAQ